MKKNTEKNTQHRISREDRKKVLKKTKTANTYKRTKKESIKRFIFGDKEKQGAGKQTVVYILLISIGFVYLYPLLYMIAKSFMSVNDLLDTSINWLPSSFYLDNYKNASKAMNFWSTFKDSVIVAGVPTLINVVICAVVGYGFARYDFKGKKIMMGVLLFSFVIPPQITMMPTYVLYSDLGILNSLKAFIIPSLLGQGIKSQLYILVFYQFFKQVPKALIEAAKIDGAGHFKSFFRIAIPSAAPAILVVFLFSIVWYWNEAYLTQLYISGAFADSTAWSTLVVALKGFNDSYSASASVAGSQMMNLNESIKMAATMLSIIPLLIMYMVLQRNFVESIDRTGITGE